ncbi:tetratricopeptide repeat protein [Chroococcidiopsis sp. FACHB-1243]|uniref:tetratricopeptide repeat protein n=1 Tax=Chroococcidiopsis sp. [FACHB-1243] TaxID=2692781 RepID=UPI00177FEAB0|nr:tetratricopeptide repeat protein [Chroococcidiopsis sp. [FACHB-1243]]MBD2309757.1 tetratricopeptide repeat protein [Chroococcidiopsis sp. [FACHB-1243]]
MFVNLDKALILIEQSRYKLAVTEIERQLAIDPNSSFAHALLSICLIEMHRDREATQAAKRAVYLAPDLSDSHYNLAKIFHIQKQLNSAKKAVQEAICLESEIADYFALLSVIQLAQGDRDRALSSAEQGLSLDAEHVLCLNLRAMALLRLRRYQEAQTTLDAAIFQEPENTAAYAIKGWLYLYCGNRDLAEQCFRESLRLDPLQEQALTGILEALKLKYSLYNFVFNYKSFLNQINIYLRMLCVSIFLILSLFNWLFLLVPFSMLLLEATQALFNLLLRFDTQWRSLHVPTH